MDKYIGFDIDCKKTATSLRPGVWPDFPASDFKFIFCNPPTVDKIGPFDFAQDKLCLGLNWLCFGFELALFF